MTRILLRLPTPRCRSAGASARPATPRRWGILLSLVLAAASGGASAAAAQAPDSVPPPDTVTVVDTVSVPVADTLVLPDTSDVLVLPDTALVRGDPAADSVPPVETFHRIPDLEGGVPAGFATGVWVFEREDILGSRAISLAELVGTVPGVIPLRGGDFGTPRTVTAFGLAGGGIRIFWDGMEMLPLDGGVADLSHVGLGGVERVRVERHPGEVRIDLTSLRNFDPRPYTLVEAGTGDLSTNLFRGTFVHPRALGGSLGLTMDRLDTRGSRGAETGVQQGTWLRYTWHGEERWAVTGELRRMKAETEVPAFPATSTRTDWVVRARGRLTPDLVAEAFTGESDLEADMELEVDDPGDVRRERRQHGLHAAWTPGPVWIRGALRLLGGHDVPSSALELSGGGDLGGVGGARASLSRESWEGEAATLLGLQAWTTPLFGLSGFATWTSGGRGVRVDTLAVPPEPDPGEGEEGEGEEEPTETPRPTHRLTDRSALRVGAVWRWRGTELSGAALALETDSLPPLGTPLDRGGLVLPGVDMAGWEVAGRVPVPFAPEGFALTGALQQWESGARYLPRRQYQAALDFHDVFMESENLEVWGGLGVEGRDPMAVPLAAEVQPDEDPETALVPATVPFYQSWYAFLQVRVVTVRIFIRWENASVRQRNQDFPDRLLPRTRALYGVRWTLWN